MSEPDLSHSSSSTRRVLVISCHFPPVGGAGVQRPTKFVKYLQQFGWEPTVLTVENPSVPAFDDSLLADIPEGTRIVKAKTLEPGYDLKKNVSANTDAQSTGVGGRLKGWVRGVARGAIKTALQPDTQVLWVPHATRAAQRVLTETPHHAIFVTAPPYSAFLLGRKLKRRFGLPLVLDFRDEWDLSSKYLENAQRDRLSAFIQSRMQRKVLRAADVVLGTTPATAERLAERVQQAGGSARSVCIYNGYDPDDFSSSGSNTPISSDRFRIVYAGTLWNLTDVSGLVDALCYLDETRPEIAGRVEFVCVGRKTSEQQAVLDRLAGTNVTLDRRDYCPHSDAVALMQSANALLLLLADVPGAERVMPAKAFEYLGLKRDVLSLIPKGSADDVVRPFFPSSTFHPDQSQQVADWIAERVTFGSRVNIEHAEEALFQYQRETQAGQLADVLDAIASPAIGDLEQSAASERRSALAGASS